MGMEEANGHQLSGQTGERYLYHFTVGGTSRGSWPRGRSCLATPP